MLIENQHKYSKYANLISFTTSNRQGQIHKPAIHVVACIHAKKKVIPLTFTQLALAQLLNTLHIMVGIKDDHLNAITKNIMHVRKTCKSCVQYMAKNKQRKIS